MQADKVVQRLIKITFILMLSACGGGGGGTSVEVAPEQESLEFVDTPTDHQINENQPLSFVVETSQLAANIETENLPAWLSITQKDKQIEISGTPDYQDAGVYEDIRVHADYNGKRYSTAAIRIEVINVNLLPIIDTSALEIDYQGHKNQYVFTSPISDADTPVGQLLVDTITSEHISATFSEDKQNLILTLVNEIAAMQNPGSIKLTVTDIDASKVSESIPVSFKTNETLSVTHNFNNRVSPGKTLQLLFNHPIPADQRTINLQNPCNSFVAISANDFETCISLELATTDGDKSFSYHADLNASSNYKLKINQSISSALGSQLAADVIDEFATTTELLITEVSGNYYIDSLRWIEIYNPNTSSLNLSAFSIKSVAAHINNCIANKCSFENARVFPLPNHVIEPGQFVILRTQDWYNPNQNHRNVLYIADAYVPYWADNGYVEVIRNSDNTTVDYVAFGNDAGIQSPNTPAHWSGGQAASLPSDNTSAYQYSLIRASLSEDSDSASDWALSSFTTPGGPNDVHCNEDTDLDGIPDCSEEEGSTFAGISLYDLGARKNQPDIFIEVDYMDSNDEGVQPRKEALQKVVQAFAKRNIAVHFDVGDLYDNSPGISPQNFDLGGGNIFPYSQGISMQLDAGDSRVDLYDIKRSNMDFRRMPVFHYMVMGSSQKADGSQGSSGLAELNANDLLITLGGWDLDSSDPTQLNILINFQAGTIMHELGHNLGLSHGGNDDINNKPNYLSVMNYMYQLDGLPIIGNNDGDRYYYKNYFSGGHCAKPTMQNPYDGDYQSFRIDYSDGSSINLNENVLHENFGLGRTASSAIDFNCNGRIDSSSIKQDINFDGSHSLLTDNNDWGKIKLDFRASWASNTSGSTARSNSSVSFRTVVDKVGDDKAPLIYETLTHPHNSRVQP